MVKHCIAPQENVPLLSVKEKKFCSFHLSFSLTATVSYEYRVDYIQACLPLGKRWLNESTNNIIIKMVTVAAAKGFNQKPVSSNIMGALSHRVGAL